MQAFFETKNGKEAFATYFVTGRSKEAAADDTQMTQGSMEVDEEAEGGSQAGPSGAREADVVSVPERSEMLLVGQDKLKGERPASLLFQRKHEFLTEICRGRRAIGPSLYEAAVRVEPTFA